LQEVFADLHIHIGRARKQWVKITASPQLTLENIIYTEAPRKGLDMVGIVDAGSLAVSAELQAMLDNGKLMELKEGGFLASNGVVLIAACEIESREGVHLLSYLPNFKALKGWQQYLGGKVHNMMLSTQKADMSCKDVIHLCVDLEGIFCPAHAYTPHKGVYGAWTDKLQARLGDDFEHVRVMEMGLSSDTHMAELLQETAQFSLLSNSDAHSLGNIGREYNLLQMQEKSFAALRLCLEGTADHRIIANYGMDPRLGKYHRSYCPACDYITDDPPPVRACKLCGNSHIIMGVYDRIMEIKDYDQPLSIDCRPAYHYRVPLQQIPGVGSKTYTKLLQIYQHEIEIIEKVPHAELVSVAGPDIAASIQAMRQGRLGITAGGGGKYGKVTKNHREQ